MSELVEQVDSLLQSIEDATGKLRGLLYCSTALDDYFTSRNTSALSLSSDAKAASGLYILQAHTDRISRLEDDLNAAKYTLTSRRAQTKNVLARISLLPTEILCQIYTCLQPSSPQDWKNLLAITQVCHHWREVATSQRSLWVMLDFQWPRAQLELWSNRARSLPLAINLNIPTFRGAPSLEEQVHSLSHLLARANSIVSTSLSEKHLRRLFDQIFVSHNTPILESLEISANGTGRYGMPFFPTDLPPSLRMLRLQSVRLRHPNFSGLKVLRIAYIGCTLSDWKSMLRSLEEVEELEISESWVEAAREEVTQGPPMFTLGALRILAVSNVKDAIFDILTFSARMPHLEELRLAGPRDSATQLIGELPSLRSLTVSNLMSGRLDPVLTALRRHRPPLRDLNISTYKIFDLDDVKTFVAARSHLSNDAEPGLGTLQRLSLSHCSEADYAWLLERVPEANVENFRQGCKASLNRGVE